MSRFELLKPKKKTDEPSSDKEGILDIKKQEKEAEAMWILEEIEREAETIKVKDDAYYQRVAERMKQVERMFSESLSPSEAKEILKQDFLGKEEIERAFDIKIEDKDIPEIPFTKEDIEKAKELGQFLILRTDKIDKKTPLTIENLNKHLKGKTKEGGKILYSDSYKSEDLYKTEIPKLSWALTSKELIPDSTSKNYLQQTELIVKYLKEKVFKDTDISESYQQAITEFEAQKDEIEKLMTTDWKKAAEKLEKLQINQLTRQTPVETIYDLIAYLHTNNQRLLENKYTWTKRRFSDGGLVVVGDFVSNGAYLYGWSPDNSSVGIGVSFSRSL
jgi:hypothetical protein